MPSLDRWHRHSCLCRGRTHEHLARSQSPPTFARIQRRSLSSQLSALEIKPMDRALAFAMLPSRIGAATLGSVGLLRLILAATGLYGVFALHGEPPHSRDRITRRSRRNAWRGPQPRTASKPFLVGCGAFDR